MDSVELLDVPSLGVLPTTYGGWTKMKIRTAENIVLGSLTMALAAFIAAWHYWVGTPVPRYVLAAATVPVVVAAFGIFRNRWKRKDRL